MNENKVENPEIILHVVAGANISPRPSVKFLGLLKEPAAFLLGESGFECLWPLDVKIQLHLGMGEKGNSGSAEITPFSTG